MKCYWCYWYLDQDHKADTLYDGHAACGRHLARLKHERRQERRRMNREISKTNTSLWGDDA